MLTQKEYAMVGMLLWVATAPLDTKIQNKNFAFIFCRIITFQMLEEEKALSNTAAVVVSLLMIVSSKKKDRRRMYLTCAT